MSFTVDYSKAQQGRYMPPEGRYECIIQESKYDKTKNGTEYLRLTLSIREDVEQEGMGEVIDWPIWRLRNPVKGDPEGFPQRTIQNISRAVQFDNGQDFDSFDQWMKALINRTIQVEIKHEEYNDRTNARVSYVFETEHPSVSPQAQGFVPVEEGDLPF